MDFRTPTDRDRAFKEFDSVFRHIPRQRESLMNKDRSELSWPFQICAALAIAFVLFLVLIGELPGHKKQQRNTMGEVSKTMVQK